MLLGGYAKNYLTYFCKLKLFSFIWNQLSLSLMANKSSWQIDGETMATVTDFSFWAPKSLQIVAAAMKLKDACSLEEKL